MRRIVDGQQSGMAGVAGELIFANDGANRAPGERRLDKIVAVEALAFDREKKFAGLHGAGIDGVSMGRRRGIELAGGGQEFRDPRKSELHAIFPAPA